MLNVFPSKPAATTRSNGDQPLIQKFKNSYSDAIIPGKKDIFFPDNILREMKMKDINSKIQGGRIGWSHRKMFLGKAGLKIRNKFTGQHPC